MISVMLPREMALDILLGLLSLEDKRPMDSSSSNVLFDEDRLNDYLEVVLTQSICDCIRDFIHSKTMNRELWCVWLERSM